MKSDENESPTKLRNFLLPPSHPIVKSVLQQMEENAVTRLEAETWKKADPSWMKELTTLCAQKGIRLSSLVAPEAVRTSRWFQLLSTREQKIVVVWLVICPEMTNIELKHSVMRCSPATDDVLWTLLPGGRQFLLNAPGGPRLLTGAEALMVQGFSKECVEHMWAKGFTNTEMLDLAGNAFCATIPIAILCSIIMNMTDHQIKHLNMQVEVQGTSDSEDGDVTGIIIP